MAEDFVGAFEHNLDNKGRVIIPACFRERLGENFTIAMNSEWTALALYPKARWEALAERLARVRDTDPKAMAYKRLVNTYATNVAELDAQGRVVLPRNMREQAGMEREIRFIGMGDYIEILDAARHEKQERADLENMAELLRHMDEHY